MWWETWSSSLASLQVLQHNFKQHNWLCPKDLYSRSLKVFLTLTMCSVHLSLDSDQTHSIYSSHTIIWRINTNPVYVPGYFCGSTQHLLSAQKCLVFYPLKILYQPWSQSKTHQTQDTNQTMTRIPSFKRTHPPYGLQQVCIQRQQNASYLGC